MKHMLLIRDGGFSALMAACRHLASAQDSGVYIKGQVGYGVFTETEVTPRSAVNTNGILGDIAGEGNLAYGLGLGYDFGDWRIELDGTSLYNDAGSIGGQPFSSAKLRSRAGMLNAVYDFSDFGRWEPYVGAGVGIAEVTAKLNAQDFLNDTGTVLVNNPACASGPVAGTTSRACIVDDTDTNFAWNLLAGVGYNITDNLTWDTTYRYADFGNVDVEGTFVQANVPPTGGVFGTLDASVADVTSHTLMTGFRYRFGKPAPVVVPVVVPVVTTYTCWDGVTEVTDLALCPVQTFVCADGVTEVTDLDLCPVPVTYLTCPDGVTSVTDLNECPVARLCDEQFRQELIYYEFDKGQSAETRNTINRILDVGQYCNVASIRVVGHTDTSGNAGYNQRLSQRRAADAREELVRQGINSALISSEGKGETEPFVQTGDGVREQLNRRTEVLITLNEVGVASFN